MRQAWLAVGMALGMAGGAGVLAGQAPDEGAPLGVLEPLVGAWEGRGAGFSTVLRYRWVIEGHVLEVTNEVRNGGGEVVARYHGVYAWDGGLEEIAYLTAGDGGEVHRGRAWWRDGVLWHEAEVSGGGIAAYASAIRPANGRLEYFADYGNGTASAALLEGSPIVYGRVAAPVGGLPPEVVEAASRGQGAR